MGVATVGVVFASVRRWFSAGAGLLAGAVRGGHTGRRLMFRFDNPDALLDAADRGRGILRDPRRRSGIDEVAARRGRSNGIRLSGRKDCSPSTVLPALAISSRSQLLRR